MSRRVLCAVAATASACGGAPGMPTACATLPLTGPQQHAGALAVTADRGRVPRGTTMTVSVLVTGPVQLVAPCDGAVEVVITDTTADLGVYDGRSTGGRCGRLALARGESLAYTVPWRPDPTLPLGGYRATVLVGDQPPVTLPLTVIATPDAAGCA